MNQVDVNALLAEAAEPDEMPVISVPSENRDSQQSEPNLWESAGRTEAANAARFVRRHGDKVRWCDPHGCFYVFDGACFAPDRKRIAEGLMAEQLAEFWREVERVSNHPDATEKLVQELVRFAKTSNSANGNRNALTLTRPQLAITPEQFDADTFLLNCKNGTLDLRTGKLRPHRLTDFLTKQCPTNYNPDAKCPTLDAFMLAIFKGDTDLISFVQRWHGYCLTGDVREQILAIYHGDGANGKSTLLDAIKRAVGTGYTMEAPRGFLMQQKNERHSTETYDLRGRRMVTAVETGAGQRLDEELIKSLTGGERIRARKLYADHEEFEPTHKLTLCTNHKPRIRGQDHAIWRRIALVPFAVKFWNRDTGETGPPELEQDKQLKFKLNAEAEGILAWLVRGCMEWQRVGLAMPDAVKAATSGYQTEQDVLGRFVAECCIHGSMKTKFSELYQSLTAWADETGENLPSRKAFAQWLELQGFERTGTSIKSYLGIGLLRENHAECDDSADVTDF